MPYEGAASLHVFCTIEVFDLLVMTPAADHRQTGAERMSRRFIVMATRFLLFSKPGN